MASRPKPASVRRLRELLEEEQEPFILELYHLEKGYSTKSCNSDTRNRYCVEKSCKKLEILSTRGSMSRKEEIPKTLHRLKSVLTKLFSWKNSKTLNCNGNASDVGRFDVSSNVSDTGRKTRVAERERFSLGSRMMFSCSCLDNYTREDPQSSQENTVLSSTDGYRALKLCTSSEQAAADGKFHWGCVEDFKQFNPVSVLEVPSNEGSPGQQHKLFGPRTSKEESPSTSSFNFPKEVLEDTVLSASLLDLLKHSMKEKHRLELLGSAFSSQYIEIKRFLQQTKQLPFDCVREVLENHGRQSRRCHFHEYIGPETIGNIICDQILSWCKQDGDVTSINQLLGSDFKHTKQQWSHFQPHIQEIGIELGDGIFVDIIDEIVTDMLDSFSASVYGFRI